MPENEIQILITAVDNVTAKMKDIESKLDKSNQNIENSNKKLGNSFNEQIKTLIAVGNIAQGLHNIWETYERVQRNVENANDRLENATIRLKRAQEDLNQVNKDAVQNQLNLEEATIMNRRAQEELKYFTDRLATGVSFTGEKLRDYEDAQIKAKQASIDLANAQADVTDEARKLKDAQDSVTMAQNGVDKATRGVQKATDDARWAYLDMGLQAGLLTANIVTLAEKFGILKMAGIGATTAEIGAMGATAARTATAVTGVLAAIYGFGAAMVALVTLGTAGYVNQLAAEAQAYDTLGGAVDTTRIKMIDLDQKMKETTGMGGTRQVGMTINPANEAIFGKGGQAQFNKDNNITGGEDSGKEGGIWGWIKGLFTAQKKTEELSVAYDKMSTQSVNDVNKIIVKLDEIPKDVYTYHHIITVYG